jgi:hypothetical protein
MVFPDVFKPLTGGESGGFRTIAFGLPPPFLPMQLPQIMFFTSKRGFSTWQTVQVPSFGSRGIVGIKQVYLIKLTLFTS